MVGMQEEMKFNNFAECLEESHKAEDLPFWEQVYKRAFPTMIAMLNHRKDGDHQRAGIDRSIILENSKQLLIDEKIRGRNKITRKVYNDIALEYLSDKDKNTPGWVCKPLLADYIAYAMLSCYWRMVMNIARDRTAEIKQELAQLNMVLKMTVQKAIKVGGLLVEQREFVGHGNFVSWLDENLDMSQRTAYKYIGLFQHRDKIAENANLQDAYQQIETLEKQERQTKEERARALIAEYRRTGIKPEGWTRDLDYRVKKDAEAAEAMQKRKEDAFKRRDDRAKERKERTSDNGAHTPLTDAFQAAASGLIEKLERQATWKEKIRLSDNGKDDAFMDAIIDYLDTLENDTRRIEACNNIIKICRNVSVELQKVKEAPRAEEKEAKNEHQLAEARH